MATYIGCVLSLLLTFAIPSVSATNQISVLEWVAAFRISFEPEALFTGHPGFLFLTGASSIDEGFLDLRGPET